MPNTGHQRLTENPGHQVPYIRPQSQSCTRTPHTNPGHEATPEEIPYPPHTQPHTDSTPGHRPWRQSPDLQTRTPQPDSRVGAGQRSPVARCRSRTKSSQCKQSQEPIKNIPDSLSPSSWLTNTFSCQCKCRREENNWHHC